MRVININGYMGSGRSAVTDFLREFESLSVPESDDEFQLLNHRYGLLSLHKTIADGNHIAFGDSLTKFMKFSNYLGRKPEGLKKLYQWGINYDSRYIDFNKKTRRFLEDICLTSWDINHPDGHINQSYIDSFLIKIKSKCFGIAPWPQQKFYLMNDDDFNNIFINYLEGVLGVDDKFGVVINNAFEINNNSKYFKLFRDPLCINVDRDIRDMYISMILSPKNKYKDHYLKISGAFDVKKFGLLQKKLHSSKDEVSDRIVNIKFEDLVLQYDSTTKKLVESIGLEEIDHKFKFNHFNPKNSRKNIRLWQSKKMHKSLLSDLLYLENNYPDLCYL